VVGAGHDEILSLLLSLRSLLVVPRGRAGEASTLATANVVREESGLTSQYQATTHLSLIPNPTLVVVFQIMWRRLLTKNLISSLLYLTCSVVDVVVSIDIPVFSGIVKTSFSSTHETDLTLISLCEY
jgi:hypothetical protein